VDTHQIDPLFHLTHFCYFEISILHIHYPASEGNNNCQRQAVYFALAVLSLPFPLLAGLLKGILSGSEFLPHSKRRAIICILNSY
jgi:hypothetical protein